MISRTRLTARKSIRTPHQAPYLLRMRVRESIFAYIYRLHLTIKCYHLNEGRGYSDYLTPPKQVDVLIHTLSNNGPYAGIKSEYSDVLKNGRPNYERYTLKGKWCLTLSYLEKRMIYARAKWLDEQFPTDDDEPNHSGNEEIGSSCNSPYI
uniref:Fgenesh protein 30 n=1 Tax=Beta vulgaris TaxID=161934 RepID=Q20CE4_BETVU|nr:Fgenesh protein 30 [Beta vulgaris]